MSETREVLLGLWGKPADREIDWEILCLRHHLGEFNSFDKPRREWAVVTQQLNSRHQLDMKQRTVEKRHGRVIDRLLQVIDDRKE